ncbi:hypothetical protein HPG69_000593 [Diceros bicornis minor]|uniref:Uncharacterized protein n=1 Tax=Diceros bicornis minor TaxID=77932 RepID=A0A7J7FIG0_DICBM|nr:hypothetical protein HPG69_000593 [Diceros bicornis minor]
MEHEDHELHGAQGDGVDQPGAGHKQLQVGAEQEVHVAVHAKPAGKRTLCSGGRSSKNNTCLIARAITRHSSTTLQEEGPENSLVTQLLAHGRGSNPHSGAADATTGPLRPSAAAAASAPPLQSLNPSSALPGHAPSRHGPASALPGSTSAPTSSGPPRRSTASPLALPGPAPHPLASGPAPALRGPAPRTPGPRPTLWGPLSRSRPRARAPPPRAIGSPGEEFPRGRRRGRGAAGGAGSAAGTLALTRTASGNRGAGAGQWTWFWRIPRPSRA